MSRVRIMEQTLIDPKRWATLDDRAAAGRSAEVTG